MWLIISIILILITWFFYKHTYERYDYNRRGKEEDLEPIKAPRWLVILVTIGLLIPYVNIVAFGVGAILWCEVRFHEEDIVLGWIPKSQLGKKVLKFLTEEV